jgi:hypothetical protein
MRIVRLIVHNRDYKNLGLRTRAPPGKLALKTVSGLFRRPGWLLYRQSANCSRARATTSKMKNGSESTRLPSESPLQQPAAATKLPRALGRGAETEAAAGCG